MVRSITIQHVPDCPNVALARERLAEALHRLGEPLVAVSTEEIADAADASRRAFPGSPTILFDGIDPFGATRTTPAFACRTYRTEVGLEGAPSVDQLLVVLRAAGAGAPA